jgi:hypothetical protein
MSYDPSTTAKERMSKLRERGVGQAGDFELDLGRHIADL